jgi:hypothetical protein
LYSRKDTLKDHIRGKHNPRYSTSDLNSLVEVVPPASSSPGLVSIFHESLFRPRTIFSA